MNMVSKTHLKPQLVSVLVHNGVCLLHIRLQTQTSQDPGKVEKAGSLPYVQTKKERVGTLHPLRFEKCPKVATIPSPSATE